MTTIDPIRIALPSKGHLHDGVVKMLETAGYKVKRASERQYEAEIAGQRRFHVVFMRPTDIVTQVHEGRCALGVTGYDLYAERALEAHDAGVVVRDLGYAGCRLVVAVPESWVDVTHIVDLADLTTGFKEQGRTFRVSTKYPHLTSEYFHRLGIYYYQVIDSDGALELHPTLGIADIIVDLTSSGTTLKENRLREIEGGTIVESAACLIGHVPSLRLLASEGDRGDLALLLDALDGVRNSEGRLLLEVVGEPALGPDSADRAAAYLLARGARHLAVGAVRDTDGVDCWRITALISAKMITPSRRELHRLGARRIVGTPTRLVFDRDEPGIFDRLVDELGIELANR
ncbi:MAG: ATP phosphoribosyltransferase [Isosphaeraceae bacterium]|nr:ATP phosphoribosyltransferase [Isosphaeraceae bacterium]